MFTTTTQRATAAGLPATANFLRAPTKPPGVSGPRITLDSIAPHIPEQTARAIRLSSFQKPRLCHITAVEAARRVRNPFPADGRGHWADHLGDLARHVSVSQWSVFGLPGDFGAVASNEVSIVAALNGPAMAVVAQGIGDKTNLIAPDSRLLTPTIDGTPDTDFLRQMSETGQERVGLANHSVLIVGYCSDANPIPGVSPGSFLVFDQDNERAIWDAHPALQGVPCREYHRIEPSFLASHGVHDDMLREVPASSMLAIDPIWMFSRTFLALKEN